MMHRGSLNREAIGNGVRLLLRNGWVIREEWWGAEKKTLNDT